MIYPAGTFFYRNVDKVNYKPIELAKFQQGRPMWFHFNEPCWKKFAKSKQTILTFKSVVTLRLLDFTKLKAVLRRRLWSEEERKAIVAFIPSPGSSGYKFIGNQDDSFHHDDYRALRAARALCRLGWDGGVIKEKTTRCYGDYPVHQDLFWTHPEVMICRPDLVLYKI
jgi:hypothetical protein